MEPNRILNKVNYTFTAKVWRYKGNAGWFFVSLPQILAKEIRDNFNKEEASFGRLAVTACIGQSSWDTAIWFDGKQSTYLLPIKAIIRRKEAILSGTTIEVCIGV